MGQADRPAELSMDDGTRQAMASLAAMLGFLFVGLGLAAYGAFQLSTAGHGSHAVYVPGGGAGGAGGEPVASGGDTQGTGSGAASAAEARRIESLIRQLDHEEWSVRSKASQDLMSLGERARPALQKALANPSSDHVRISVERLIEALDARKRR